MMSFVAVVFVVAQVLESASGTRRIKFAPQEGPENPSGFSSLCPHIRTGADVGLAATMSQAVFRSVKFTFAGFALVGFNDERGSGWTAARCVPTDQVPVTGHAQREEEINESVVYHCARSADRVPARASTVPQPSSAAVTDGVRSGTGAARLTACVRQKK